MMGSNLVRPV